jgi:stage III sporulation protein AF
MMAMLILWLKKIILLVLLATFLDLLLPNNVYNKYVKLVMGLLILLTLLSPILDLFRKDIPFAQLSFTVGEGTNAPDFARVDALVKKLAATNDEQANQYVEAQMGELMKKQIEQQHGVKVESVNVQVVPEEQKTTQPIQHVSVVLAQSKSERSTEEKDGQGVHVKPMEPVKVEISVGNKAEPSEQKQESVTVLAEKSQMEKTIAAAISVEWNVPHSAISVTWKDAGEEGK